MLVQRRRRRANTEPASGRHLVSDGEGSDVKAGFPDDYKPSEDQSCCQTSASHHSKQKAKSQQVSTPAIYLCGKTLCFNMAVQYRYIDISPSESTLLCQIIALLYFALQTCETFKQAGPLAEYKLKKTGRFNARIRYARWFYINSIFLESLEQIKSKPLG